MEINKIIKTTVMWIFFGAIGIITLVAFLDAGGTEQSIMLLFLTMIYIAWWANEQRKKDAEETKRLHRLLMHRLKELDEHIYDTNMNVQALAIDHEEGLKILLEEKRPTSKKSNAR